MSQALLTLVFLIAAWASVSALLASADESGSKILAALKGRSLAARDPLPVREITVRLTRPAAVQQVQRAPIPAAEWRAAA